MIFNARGQLPDRERAICMKLLLRITLKEDVFDDYERSQAQEWYSMVEGSRKRNNRPDTRPVEASTRGRGRGKGRGSRGGRGGRGGRGRETEDRCVLVVRG